MPDILQVWGICDGLNRHSSSGVLLYIFFLVVEKASHQPSQWGKHPIMWVLVRGYTALLLAGGVWACGLAQPLELPFLGHWSRGYEVIHQVTWQMSHSSISFANRTTVKCPVAAALIGTFSLDCSHAGAWPYYSYCPANLNSWPFSESGSPAFPLILWTYPKSFNKFLFMLKFSQKQFLLFRTNNLMGRVLAFEEQERPEAEADIKYIIT